MHKSNTMAMMTSKRAHVDAVKNGQKKGSSRLMGKDGLDVFCWEGVAARVLNW